MSVLSVRTAEKSYQIHIESGLLAKAGELVRGATRAKKVCVVTDEIVAKNYLIPLMRAMEAGGFVTVPPIILPAGEATKNFSNFQLITEKCLSYKLDRSSALIALGGGVVGDITGFAASVIMRGIGFIQIPTTLLAQVDSSVGGKTAINTAQGKNLIGSFYQPDIVLIDTNTLKTLPEREMRAGYAEVLKYALIADHAFFEWLEAHGQGVLAKNGEALQHAIETSCRAKADIVAADEREQNDVRALLNFGHTFGHAFEAIGGYDGRILHGEAVAIGMGLAFDFSVAHGLCPDSAAKSVRAHLSKTGLMQMPPFQAGLSDILQKMREDKKSKDGRITLVLTRGIGKAFVSRDVDEADLTAFLQSHFQG